MTMSYKPVNKNNNLGRTALLTLIYFLYLYSFIIPGVHTGTVLPILVVLVIYTVYSYLKGETIPKKLRTTKMVRSYWFWNVFLLLYVFTLLQIFGSGDGDTPLNDYKLMLIILPIFYISGNLLFQNIEELMKILYIGVVIQSVIIIAALLIPSLTVALFLLIPEGGYNSEHFGGLDMITQYGYHIGLGVFTSAGSLKMAIGQIGACYYLIRNKGSKLFYHLILFFLITIATSVVSRTGLLISVAGLLTVLLVKRKQGGNRALGYMSLALFSLLVGYFLVVAIFPSAFLEDTFQRLITTAEIGVKDTYFTGYVGEGGNNVLPPISPETLIGLGITYGISGSGITTITDGGFMRNYSAMGLIVAVINYLIIASFFIKRYKTTSKAEYKGIILFMFFVLVFGEFKEYFVYYIYPMCFFFLTFSLIERSVTPKYLQSTNRISKE